MQILRGLVGKKRPGLFSDYQSSIKMQKVTLEQTNESLAKTETQEDRE